jgi:hypothetical protein
MGHVAQPGSCQLLVSGQVDDMGRLFQAAVRQAVGVSQVATDNFTAAECWFEARKVGKSAYGLSDAGRGGIRRFAPYKQQNAARGVVME